MCNLCLPCSSSNFMYLYSSTVMQPIAFYAPALIGEGIKRWCCLTSVAYIGPKSRTERPRKTKIGTGVVHVTRDSDTTFKVKRSRSPGCFTHRGLNASGSGERGNILGVGNYCYTAMCSAALSASAPTEGGEGRGISWRPPAYSLFIVAVNCIQLLDI